jgi:hypothetical protein
MKESLNQNLNEDDKQNALNSLRILVNGIPIKDDNNEIIGYIEKPNIDAIKFVLNEFKGTTKEWD